jgi:PAS domain S-box-containing protein
MRMKKIFSWFLNNSGDFKTVSERLEKTLADLQKEVSERKKAEDELRKTRNYLKNIIDSMSSVLISINRDGNITQWNSAAERETGIQAPDALNRKIWELIPVLKQFENDFEKVIKNSLPIEIRRENLSEEEKRYFNISFYPLIFNGTRDVVIRMDDITELEKKEFQLRQAQKMETVGTLAGGLAHDFNNVLSGIIGSVSLLRFMQDRPEGIDGKTLREHTAIIEESAKRASEMVGRLLSLARKQEMVLTNVDLSLVVRNVLKICSVSFDKSVEIRTSIPENPAFTRADFTQVEQVLLNLCVNAEHAMTIMKNKNEIRGGILMVSLCRINSDQAMLHYHPEAGSGDYWMLSVEDTGVGINKSIMQKIFDPFFTTKDRDKGTGLGLTMVYNIVHQLGGFIEFSSRAGTGSEFRVYLPVIEKNNIPEMFKNIEPAKGNETILLADDDDNVGLVTKLMLEKCGYSVILAKDGRECVDQFKKGNKIISLVILDMSMPKMSGKDAYKEMRKIDPGLKVLLSSGLANDRLIFDTIAMGAADVINKPFTMIELAGKVREVLDKNNPA